MLQKKEKTTEYFNSFRREISKSFLVVKEFDWSTMTYEEKPVSGLSDSTDVRNYPVCTILDGKLIFSAESGFMPMLQIKVSYKYNANDDFNARLPNLMNTGASFSQGSIL